MSELRRDPLTGTWVIVSEARRGRPHDHALQARPTQGNAPCPFCPGEEARTPPEVFALRAPGGAADGPGWRVRVVPNKFPALQPGGVPAPQGLLLRRVAGVGAHEVVVETPHHTRSHGARAPEEWDDLATALQARLRAHGGDARVQYALAFKNHGPAAGASLAHPHSQVLAMPIVPERVAREVEAFEGHARLNERCLLEDLLREELDERARIVAQDDDFVLWAPFAARVPYEMLLAPRAHAPRFEDAPAALRAGFARMLGIALARLERVLAGHPLEGYHFALHTAPARGRHEGYHWHCEVLPSLAFHAGLEKGGGVYLNHLGPEASAEALRG